MVYLAKDFRKFLKFKKDGKSFEKGKFSNFKKDKGFKKKDSKYFSPSLAVTCYECNGHGHVLPLFSAKFACNSVLRNLIFRWE